MPPSSPAMKMPGTLVSNCGDTSGMSMPRRSVPNTSLMASNGQAAKHAPWPMQAAALISVALPATMPSACSGQALTHDDEPMQRTGSTTGCSDGGSTSPAATACCSSLVCRACVPRRRHRYQASTAASTAAYSHRRFIRS